jgi:hypothetical protein
MIYLGLTSPDPLSLGFYGLLIIDLPIFSVIK